MALENNARRIEVTKAKEDHIFHYGQWFSIAVDDSYSGWEPYMDIPKRLKVDLREANTDQKAELHLIKNSAMLEGMSEKDFASRWHWYAPAGPTGTQSFFHNNGKIQYDLSTAPISPYVYLPDVHIAKKLGYQVFSRYEDNILIGSPDLIDVDDAKYKGTLEILDWLPVYMDNMNMSYQREFKTGEIIVPDNPQILSSLQFMINYLK